MSSITIILDNKSGSEHLGNFGIERTEKNYLDNFLEVTHDIKYFGSYGKPYSYWNWFWFQAAFRKNIDKRKFYYYYVSKADHILRKIYVYFSKLHLEIPLIVGFESDTMTRYYIYDQINKAKYSYGFPTGGFTDSELKEKLIYENNTRNKLKFTIDLGSQRDYDKTEDVTSHEGFIKYSHSVKDDLSHDNHVMSKQKLFENEIMADDTIIDELVSNKQNGLYDFINLYCTKDKKVLLFEFINDSEITYFRRKDKVGYYWIEDKGIKITNNHYGPTLEEIENEVNSTVIYQVDKITNDTKYTDKYIQIEQQNQTQNKFIIYKHKLLESNIKKTYLFYNGKGILSVKNEKMSENEDHLGNFDNQNFTEISTYAFESTPKYHLLIKLINSGKKVYYFQRFYKDSTKWRQVCLQNLKDLGVNVDSKTKLESVMDNSLTTKLLKSIRFEIHSIIVLLNMNSRYGLSEFEGIVGTKGSEKEVPPINNVSNFVPVRDVSTDFACLSKDNYKVFMHNLKASIRDIGDIDHELYIRLYLGTDRIRLYNDDKDTEETFLTYSTKKGELYTYFYDAGGTPLLFCYDDKAYKPKDKGSYNSKWINVKSIKCSCENRSRVNQNLQLLKTLSDVTGALNVVYLSKKQGVGKDYIHTKLFKVYEIKHLENLKPGSIRVYKDERSDAHLTLNDNGVYKKQQLDYIDLYFNKYENETPLILVLHFKGPRKPQSRYFICSEFENNKNKSKNMTELHHFKNEKDILDILLRENNQLNFLTFEISKIPTYKGIEKYNLDKIQVQEDSSGVNYLVRNGFRRYIHKPIRGDNGKACITYLNNLLCTTDGGSTKVIEDIQDKVVGYLNVYYSINEVTDALLIEFNQGGSMKNDYNLFYYHNRDSNGLLYWKEVKKGEQVFEEHFGNYSLYSQMTQMGNIKLENILKKIKYNLAKSIVFVVNARGGTYDKTFVTRSFTDHNKYWIINKTIKVNDKVKGKFSCLTDKGFKIIEHDFSSCVEHIKEKENVDMKFIISNGTNRHNLIQFFDKDGRKNINLKYFRPHDKFYTYVYGTNEHDFSTPLLLCYNGNAFRPKNMEDYKSHKWTKVEINNSDMCDSSSNEQLLDVLSYVVGFLNVVQLSERPPDDSLTAKEPNKTGGQPRLYTAHEYNNQQISIKVSYENKVCYRSYVHQPYGIKGEGSNFRLGKIIYEGKEYISYDLKKELTKVSVYYSVYDIGHKYALLVKLDFKGGTSESEYYRLDDKVDLKWEKLLSDRYKGLIEKLSNDNNLENGLYDIRTKIDIKYNDDEKKHFFFNPEKCTEDNLDIPAIAGGTVGTAAVVGTGVTIGVVVAKKLAATAVTTFVAAAVS